MLSSAIMSIRLNGFYFIRFFSIMQIICKFVPLTPVIHGKETPPYTQTHRYTCISNSYLLMNIISIVLYGDRNQ